MNEISDANKKYKYKVETHLHTSQASACAVNTGAEMARACKRDGCCAIVVTDHFFNGNTNIRGNYAWDDKISMFMKGYENAKREGDNIGIDVYFGFEYNYRGAEFLIYNYSEEKLRAYPEIMTDNIEKIFTNIKKSGGFIIHAHPFRHEAYILDPGQIFPEYTEAVEVINTHNRTKESNRLAMDYAEEYNLIKFGGSDTHSAHPQDGGMLFERKPESLYDIIDMAKKEECVILGEQYLI
ncbi:MAG: PHP domain-containing protein [Oscillospiraceae bacterium]|nr:PHP domain-containing protein [Oscillospiraceae bacterium]